MSKRLLRATIRFKWLFNRLCNRSVMIFEYIIYFVCCFFLCALASAILYNVILLVIEDDVLKLYIMGIMITIGIALSITYITRFNKKYRYCMPDCNRTYEVVYTDKEVDPIYDISIK